MSQSSQTSKFTVSVNGIVIAEFENLITLNPGDTLVINPKFEVLNETEVSIFYSPYFGEPHERLENGKRPR